MPLTGRIMRAIQALQELGPRPLVLFGLYQAGLRSGWTARQVMRGWQALADEPDRAFTPNWEALPPGPDREAFIRVLEPGGQQQIIAQADEITAGQVRLFGGDPVPLDFRSHGPAGTWLDWELGRVSCEPDDIKWIWEPARFGWAFCLARAYCLTQDGRYPEAFWRAVETFWQANPPGQGPHWVSAQEVALRIIAWTFCLNVFRPAAETSPERIQRLARSIGEHAARIPPTLIYARSQNNNHLLTEAAGLYTAGVLLTSLPQAAAWRTLGLRWMNAGLAGQIARDGSYSQHSTNYHRLMLQIAGWMNCLFARNGSIRADFEAPVRQKLAAATRWLLALLDPVSGQVPNLGPNDGAYILPLSTCPWEDYRPVLAAAGQAFLGERLFPPGAWDEIGLWLPSAGEASQNRPVQAPAPSAPDGPFILKGTEPQAWGYLRATHFTGRPGHADQLHLDLWWRGLNLAQDAGTYLYNAPPPWQNALTTAAVHNTLTLNGQDQMTRAGRFLYLDWAQAEVVERKQNSDGTWNRLTARHDGYRRLGAWHQRTVAWVDAGGWRVEDRVLSRSGSLAVQQARLHWLLPDWPCQVQEAGTNGWELRLSSPFGVVGLRLASLNPQMGGSELNLVRAGEKVFGPGRPTVQEGWASPTYGVRRPALACSLTLTGPWPQDEALGFISEWSLPRA